MDVDEIQVTPLGRDQSRLGDGLGEEHEFPSVILSLGRQNVAWATECRLGEGASLGRERSRLGENAQDFELATGGFSLGRECLAWARMPRLGESSHAWARMAQAMRRKESRKPRNESTDRKRLGRGPSRVFSDGHSGGLYSLSLRVDVRSGPTRSIPVWRWLKMDRNSTHIRGYHFTMSPEGQWSSDGYRYTYSGPCGLEVHMECTGSSMMIPHPDAVIDASFTLPLRRNPIPGVGVSFPPVQSDGAGPSSGCRTWPDVVDAPSSSRAFRSDGRGAGSCKKSPELRLSSPLTMLRGFGITTWRWKMRRRTRKLCSNVSYLAVTELTSAIVGYLK
ncbi:unnamed protein product [Lupinus luteus]|uniref:Uncharacterized protein n=1 Tax=Lupinus luteus TaxID=3873 RepID=A0AAV1XIL1_LUPLU